MRTPTVSFEIRLERIREDGKAPIYFRATYARKSRYTTTGVHVEPRHWNKRKHRIKASCSMAALFNRRLDELHRRGLEAAYDAGSAEEVISALSGSHGTFTAYVEELIEGMDEDGAYWDRQKYAGLLAKLHDCLGEPLGWAAITPQALQKYERHLREGRGNQPNTIHRELSRLRTVVKRAIRDGILRSDRNPYDRFTMPKKQRVEKRRLSLEETDRLAAVELEWGTRQRTVRDMWLVSFYGCGVRLSDALTLTVENIDGQRIKYRSQKTGSLHDSELPPEALEILRPYLKDAHAAAMEPPARRAYPYVFRLLQMGDDTSPEDLRRREHRATAKYNKALKQIAPLAGIDPIGFSSHTARHTFSDLARHHGDYFVVSLALDHSDPTTTRGYMAADDTTALDALTRSMWRGADG